MSDKTETKTLAGGTLLPNVMNPGSGFTPTESSAGTAGESVSQGCLKTPDPIPDKGIIEAALEAGVLTKKGTWFFLGESQLANGANQLIELFENQPGVLNKVIDMTLTSQAGSASGEDAAKTADGVIATGPAGTIMTKAKKADRADWQADNLFFVPDLDYKSMDDSEFHKTVGVRMRRRSVVKPMPKLHEVGGERTYTELDIRQTIEDERVVLPELTKDEAQMLIDRFGPQNWYEFAKKPGFITCVVKFGLDDRRIIVPQAIFAELTAKV